MCLEASSIEEKTAIFQIYHPTKNTNDAGLSYMQQKERMKTDTCLLGKFDDDLIAQIDDIRMEGFQIIVMGDFNMDLTSTHSLIRQLRDRDITDIMKEKIGYEEVPNTRNPGSKPIDGIFASATLEVIRCGYDAGDNTMSDHCFLWAQFLWNSMLGPRQAKVCSFKERPFEQNIKRLLQNSINSWRIN